MPHHTERRRQLLTTDGLPGVKSLVRLRNLLGHFYPVQFTRYEQYCGRLLSLQEVPVNIVEPFERTVQRRQVFLNERISCAQNNKRTASRPSLLVSLSVSLWFDSAHHHEPVEWSRVRSYSTAIANRFLKSSGGIFTVAASFTSISP